MRYNILFYLQTIVPAQHRPSVLNCIQCESAFEQSQYDLQIRKSSMKKSVKNLRICSLITTGYQNMCNKTLRQQISYFLISKVTMMYHKINRDKGLLGIELRHAIIV